MGKWISAAEEMFIYIYTVYIYIYLKIYIYIERERYIYIALLWNPQHKDFRIYLSYLVRGRRKRGNRQQTGLCVSFPRLACLTVFLPSLLCSNRAWAVWMAGRDPRYEPSHAVAHRLHDSLYRSLGHLVHSRYNSTGCVCNFLDNNNFFCRIKTKLSNKLTAFP